MQEEITDIESNLTVLKQEDATTIRRRNCHDGRTGKFLMFVSSLRDFDAFSNHRSFYQCPVPPGPYDTVVELMPANNSIMIGKKACLMNS
jgi:hypothetical protein